MTDLVTTEAVEAANRALHARHDADDVFAGDARAAVEAAAPHIAAQATTDLRARIEALRDEWRVVADDRCGCAICTATRRHLDALDALLREGAR